MTIIQNDIKTIPLVTTPDSRFVVFSDAHRGDGSGADDFAANSLIFKCALDYYLAEGFTLVELGDAEELCIIFIDTLLPLPYTNENKSNHNQP